MKRWLLSCLVLLMAVSVKAQNIRITNTSCQPVLIAIQGDRIPGCGTTFGSNQYYVAIGATLQLSMYPGGPYPVINWLMPLPGPNSRFTSVKVYDPPPYAWQNGTLIPCLGPTSFASGSTCPVFGASDWTNPNMVVVKIY